MCNGQICHIKTFMKHAKSWGGGMGVGISGIANKGQRQYVKKVDFPAKLYPGAAMKKWWWQ